MNIWRFFGFKLVKKNRGKFLKDFKGGDKIAGSQSVKVLQRLSPPASVRVEYAGLILRRGQVAGGYHLAAGEQQAA